MLPANSPFCEFISSGYGVWLDIFTSGVDPLDFGAGDGSDGGDDGDNGVVRRDAVRRDGGSPALFSRVGSCCFLLYSFATDVLTAASSRVPVLRPGSAALFDGYAYVGPLSSLAGVVGPALPASSIGASFVFGLVPYSVPAVLPVGLLSASPSGLGCVSLSLSPDPAASAAVAAGAGAASSAVGVGGVGAGSGFSASAVSPECIFLVLRGDDGGDVGDFFRVPSSPPLSYYTWSFVRSSLSRLYSSVGASDGAGSVGSAGSVGGTVGVGAAGAVGGIVNTANTVSSPPLRFSDLSVRFSDGSSLSDSGASEDEIASLIHSVRRAFD